MKKLLLLCVCASFIFALEVPKNHIVDTNWLEKNLNDENLVVVDIRKKDDFLKGHIKGAVNIPKKQWFQGEVNGIKKYYDSPEQVQELLQNAGITDESTVVFYSYGLAQKHLGDGASALWTLYLYGLKNTAVLNGGFAKWTYEKKKTTKELRKVTKSDIEIEEFNKDALASLDDVLEGVYDEDVQISDARISAFYLGKKGRKDLARKGRIKNAKLTPMIRHAKKENSYYVFSTKKESSKILYNSGFGVELDKPLIVYCNTGHKARALWFIGKFVVGMKDVKVYDGSMVEYTRTKLPMEVGESF